MRNSEFEIRNKLIEVLGVKSEECRGSFASQHYKIFVTLKIHAKNATGKTGKKENAQYADNDNDNGNDILYIYKLRQVKAPIGVTFFIHS